MNNLRWFRTGFEAAIKEKEKNDKLGEIRRSRSASTFWLREGGEAQIMFLDDTCYSIYEHRVYIDGKWQQYTCVKEFQPCPLCKMSSKNVSRASFVSYFTIIDFTPFQRRDGTLAKYSKRLYGAKGNMPRILYDQKQRLGTLVGHIFKVKRYGKNSSASGDYIEFVEKAVDPLKLVATPEDLKPFDYATVLAPPTEEELAALGLGNVVVTGFTNVDSDFDLLDDKVIL